MQAVYYSETMTPFQASTKANFLLLGDFGKKGPAKNNNCIINFHRSHNSKNIKYSSTPTPTTHPMTILAKSALAAFILLPSFVKGKKNDEFVIACVPLIDAAPAACDAFLVDQDVDLMLNTCTQAGIYNAVQASGSHINEHIPHLAGHISSTVLTIDEDGSDDRRDRNLRGAPRQEERRLRRRICHTTDPSLAIIIFCCVNTDSYSFCGSPMADRRRELTPIAFDPAVSAPAEENPTTTGSSVTSGARTAGIVTPPGAYVSVSAAQMEQYLPSISEECSSQFKAQAELYLGMDQEAACFAAASDVVDLNCYAIMVTGGLPELA